MLSVTVLIITAAVFLTAVLIVHASEEQPSEEIAVRLRFQGEDLSLSFPPTAGDAMLMARKFCLAQLPDREEDVRKSCMKSIGDYLIGEVEKRQRSHSLSDSLSQRVANAQEREREGETLAERERQSTQAINGMLSVTLDIAGERFVAAFDRLRETPTEAARRFCHSHREKLQLSEETIGNCVIPVENQFHMIAGEQGELTTEVEVDARDAAERLSRRYVPDKFKRKRTATAK